MNHLERIVLSVEPFLLLHDVAIYIPPIRIIRLEEPSALSILEDELQERGELIRPRQFRWLTVLAKILAWMNDSRTITMGDTLIVFWMLAMFGRTEERIDRLLRRLTVISHLCYQQIGTTNLTLLLFNLLPTQGLKEFRILLLKTILS